MIHKIDQNNWHIVRWQREIEKYHSRNERSTMRTRQHNYPYSEYPRSHNDANNAQFTNAVAAAAVTIPGMGF